MIDKTQLISSIQAGEDTKLELKEVVFRGDRIGFAREEGRAASRLAEVSSVWPIRKEARL